MMTMRKLPWLWLIPPLLLACWLGARGLDADALWLDELRSIRDAGGVYFGPLTLAGIWERVATGNPWHTPGFFMLLHGWARLVGWEPPLLRVVPLLCGLLAVAWSYRLGRAVGGVEAGVYTAAALATSVFFVYQFHELRMYTLLVLLTLIVVWAYLRLLAARAPSRGLWLALLLSVTAAAYTHYFAFMPLLAIGVYHLLFARKNRRWWSITGVMLLAGLLYLPWLPVPFTALAVVDEYPVVPLTVEALLSRLALLFSNGVLPLLLVLPFALMVRRARRLAFIALVTLTAILLSQPLLGVLGEDRLRYTIPLWGLWSVLVGVGIARLRQLPAGRIVGAAALALWLLSGVVNQSSQALLADQGGADTRPFPLHTAARLAHQWMQPDDAVVFYLPDAVPLSNRLAQLADFYFHDLSLDYIFTTTERRPGDAPEESRIRQSQVRDQGRVWLASLPGWESASLPAFESDLDAQYARCDTAQTVNGLRLTQFVAASVCCIEASAASRAQFGDGIVLVDAAVPPNMPGEVLPLTLFWSLANDVPPHEYSASLQVMDERGAKVAQVDYGLPPARYTCQQTEIPADLPAGMYRVGVSVYAWRSGERLRLVEDAASDVLWLEAFRVE
jgi:hypothetical protein